MQRTTGPNATPQSQFTDGNAAAGTPATTVSAAFLNGVQEELASVIEHTGAALDGTKVDQLLRAIFNLAHPIGSIYIDGIGEQNPQQILGFGTWQEIGVGRVLVGLDPVQTEFNLVGKTGGAKTHTLTVDEMPEHDHPTAEYSGPAGVNSQHITAQTNGGASPRTGSTGGGQAHNNLQPYEVVGRFWRRTA